MKQKRYYYIICCWILILFISTFVSCNYHSFYQLNNQYTPQCTHITFPSGFYADSTIILNSLEITDTSVYYILDDIIERNKRSTHYDKGEKTWFRIQTKPHVENSDIIEIIIRAEQYTGQHPPIKLGNWIGFINYENYLVLCENCDNNLYSHFFNQTQLMDTIQFCFDGMSEYFCFDEQGLFGVSEFIEQRYHFKEGQWFQLQSDSCMCKE